jgi:hypothetical protein
MLFRPTSVAAMWDTWLCHCGATWHLFYLITERGLGEGVGLATSPDGVHWTDRGPVLRQAPDALWLGTGDTWWAPSAGPDGAFVMNVSEWRGRDQAIHFATSRDLVTWQRLGPEAAFPIDARWYEATPRRWGWLFAPRSMLLMMLAMATGAARRWDSIHAVPRPGGGFWGFWTATVRGRPGFGFGQSDDGLRWEALPPPSIDWGPLAAPRDLELGAVEPVEGRWLALVGSLRHRGMLALVADRPEGPYRLAPHNAHVLASSSLRLNTYYARLFASPDGVLVHHHALTRRLTRRLRPVCWLSPLKRPRLDPDGTVRLAWWEGNDALLGEPLPLAPGLDLEHGAAITATLRLPEGGRAGLFLRARRRRGVGLWIHPGGVVTIGVPDVLGREDRVFETIDRALPRQDRYALTLLVRDTLLELYLDGVLIQAYSLPLATNGRLDLDARGGAAFDDVALRPFRW